MTEHTPRPPTTPPIVEDPDGKVREPATFYCCFGGVLDGHLGFERMGSPPFFPPVMTLEDGKRRPDPAWILGTSPHFEQIHVPPALQGVCAHYRLTATALELEPFVVPLKLVFDHVADHIPDFGAWPPFGLVSDRAKDALIRLDPEGHVFLPAALHRSDGTPLAGAFHHWLPRHRIVADASLDEIGTPRRSLPFPGPFARPGFAWHLCENAELRAYLSGLPVWGMHMDYIRYVLNAGTFAALRAARLTGLVENTAEFAGDRKMHESIGHIP